MFGPRPVSPVPGWITTHVPPAGYLCHCPELAVASAKDADGQVWHLLGLAIQTEAGRPDPVDGIAAATRDTIQDLYQTWAGRWVLMGAGELHMDSGGFLGCFYTGHSGRATEELWLSSSAALLTELTGVDWIPTRNVVHGMGVDWYTPPRSRFAPIRRLLPSQILTLPDGDILPRRLLPELPETLAYDDILDRLRGYLATALRAASGLSKDLHVALTAGYDSRLLLAAARYAGVSVKTYTHVYPGITQADLALPPELTRAVGLTHSFYSEGAYREDLAATYYRHTAGHSVGERTGYFVSHGQFDWTRKGTLLLRAGGFEVGRCYWWRKFPEERSHPSTPDAETIVRGFRYKDSIEGYRLADALGEWIEWTRRTPHAELDWRDRLYLEQRLGGWLSCMEQGLDLIDGTSLQLANSGYFYAHVLRIPPEKRCASQHHADLIESMAPELLAFPFNPTEAAELIRENKTLTRRASQLKKRNSELEQRNAELTASQPSPRDERANTISDRIRQIPGVRRLVRRKPAE